MDPTFFHQSTLEMARNLLGTELVHESREGKASGRIVEVEAYRGPSDKAAHSYSNRKTKRTRVMFGPPGHAYLFRIYGMHICFNIVTAPADHPEAILVRALEPVEGLSLMAKRRNIHLETKADGTLKTTRLKSLTNGPGKLCQALGLSMNHYGADLTRPPLYLRPGSHSVSQEDLCTGPRINIDYAEEARFFPWRFWLCSHPFVSKP